MVAEAVSVARTGPGSKPTSTKGNVNTTSLRHSRCLLYTLVASFITFSCHEVLITSSILKSPSQYIRAILPNQVTVNESSSRVGLLFLSRGRMPLEPVWREFLENCPVDWRRMFQVFVHTPMEHEYAEDSIFRGRVISDHVTIEWANHSMMEAERVLFAAAFQDASIHTFVLLSEDSMPLYPADIIYLQLIQERKSRVRACQSEAGEEETGIRRWSPKMEAYGVMRQNWRKSSQWVVLKRNHVQLLLQDERINEAFKRFCNSGNVGFCVSDEHYIPTLLSIHHREHECECDAEAMRAVWTGYASPRTFYDADITRDIVQDVFREAKRCEARNTSSSYIQQQETNTVHSALPFHAKENSTFDTKSIAPRQNCPLFARKMSPRNISIWTKVMREFVT